MRRPKRTLALAYLDASGLTGERLDLAEAKAINRVEKSQL
jgi:hypothetical protein